MKKSLLNHLKTSFACLFALALAASVIVQTANAQVTVTGSTGANATYARLGLAFSAINGTAQTGNNIVITITANTTESASAVLNAGAWATMKMYPTVAGLSISGNLAAPLIDLSGADNVTFDGRVNATGSAKDLIITNTSTSATAGTSTIRFINDATTNTVKYCTIKGSGMDASAGVLFFSTSASGTTGNDGNTIDNNDITNSLDANRPLSAVYSNGTSAKTNSGNTISNNNIYNFLNRGTASNGIALNTYNTGWTISGNSLYETASFVPTAGVAYYPIGVFSATSSDIAISGNYIGGSAPLCGGTAWTKSGASYTNAFYGIYLVNGPTVSTTTSVQGNTIKNFAWSDAGTSGWNAIVVANSATGDINIGTVTGNTIGATTGTGSIVVTSAAANGYVWVLYISGTGTINCQNNTIGAITAANTQSAYPTHLYGIYKYGAGNTTISNNLVGSTGTANSIICSSASTSYPQYMYAIASDGTGAVTISGNTVSKLTNSNNYASGGYTRGIHTSTGTNAITNNTVRDLSSANSYTGSGSSATLIGISQVSTVAAAQTVSGNTIYGLTNTYASFAGYVTGLYYTGPANASTISGNFIHSITATNAGAYITGIYSNGGTATYSNNIVNLGNNTGNMIFGVHDQSGTNYYYFNTLYIGGAPTTTANQTYCFYGASVNTRNCRNNLFINARSNNGATGTHWAAAFISTTGITTDYNDYVASGTGGTLGWWAATKTTLAQIQAMGQDANSINTNPLFANAGGTTAADYLPASPALLGVAGTGITTDYTGTTRTTNSMGGYDIPVSGLVSVTATLGTATGGYSNLKSAFAAINAGTHKGAIVIKINGSTSESASALLNASGTGSSSYSSINVYPTLTGLSISGDLAAPLINLSGADNVTFDGRVNATGSTKDLIITNTSTSATTGTSTIRFINDATTNTVKYCTIKGSGLDAGAGVLFFSSTTGTTGNDGNTIDNNNITNSLDANRPLVAVYSAGTSAKTNSGITISNNNIYNFLNRGTNSYGVRLAEGNTGWTISGNSFYETASFVPTANTSNYSAILVSNTTNSDVSISGNFIGGSAPACGGTAWTKTAQATNAFNGIFLVPGPTVSATTSVQGNTIKNFAWSDATTSSWYGIYVTSNATGNINIGTVTGNTIGAGTGTGSIVVTSAAANGYVWAIKIDGTGTINCQNNTIGAITAANTQSAYPTHLYGIYKSGSGTTTISNNLVGSTGTANSIICSSISTIYPQYMLGIGSDGTGAVTISGNTVSKLTNSITSGQAGFLKGILTGSGTNTITNNTVRDLSSASTYTGGGTSSPVLGIGQVSTTAAVQTVSGNTIYGLTNTNASFAGTLTGLYYSGPVQTSMISGNFIHSLSVTSNSGAQLSGIHAAGGTSWYYNNIVSLGGNTATYLYGIYDASGINNYYFNTVYIGGSPTSAGNGYCMQNTNSSARIIRNNLFVNTRTGGSTHYGITFSNLTGVTIDYNDYFVSSGTMGWFNGTSATTLAAFQAATGQDSHSISTNPLFASAGGTLAANYIPASLALLGVNIPSITTDYAGTTRTNNSMGAYDYPVSGLVSLTATVGTATGAFSNLKSAFDAINAGTHKGAIVIKINGSTTESASAVLNASGTGSSNYTSVNVYPTVTGLSISGNLAVPLIDLSGADNVTFDGRVNATGSAKDLVINNTSNSATAGTSTIRFINDASANTVKYCTLKGSTMNGGILTFSTTTGTTGNDGNTIDNNNITNSSDANRPIFVVYSGGTTAKTNSGNTISNNNIYNFFNRGTTSYGIYVGEYNTGWTISGNSFYETASFVPTADAAYYVIIVANTTNSDITISGNFIGGNAPACGGTWTKTANANNHFRGIYLTHGPTLSTTTSVQGNTIKNFAWSDNANSNWMPIYVTSGATGDINIGNVTGNTIGAVTGTGSIALTTSGTSGTAYGIDVETSGTVNCQNNTIGSITTVTTNNSYAYNFYGFVLGGSGNKIISNNLIGSTSTANSINCSSQSGSNGQTMYGIYSVPSAGSITISGNTISKLNNNCLFTSSFIKGIYTSSGTNTITNNTIRDLSAASLNTGSGNSSVVVGIAQLSTTAAQTVSGNTIYNLSGTYWSSTGYVTGIYYAGPATASTISGNFIHSLSTNSNSGVTLIGIHAASGTSTYSNNIISLGGNTPTYLYGIWDVAGINNYYFNTVYIGGAPTGTSYGYCMNNQNTSTRNIRNNLFVNTRTGGLYGTTFNNLTGVTIDYNDYLVSIGFLGWFNGTTASTLAAFQAATGQDSHSLNTLPAFASPGGTLAANYQVPLSSALPGITIAGQSTDYAGTTRAATPTMGAYEKGLFSQVVTFTAITPKTYGDADFTPVVTASSGLTEFTFTSSNTAVATVNSSSGLVHIVGAGMTNITATQAGNSTWASATASSSLTVIAKALTLASAAAQNKTYDGTNAAILTGTLTGVINSDDVTVSKTGTFASINVGTGIAVTSTSTLGGAKAGNYSLTQPTGLTANITTGVQVITFGPLAAKTYGDAPFVVSATGGASGNPVTFTSSDPAIASCTGTNGTTVSILKAGSCTIYADQEGNSLYAAATQVPQTLTINKANQVITLSPLPVGSVSLYAFGSPIQVTATSNSGLTVAISLGAGSAATLNELNQLVSVGSTGTVVINLSVEANDNYNAASSSYTFDVVKNNQTITFGALSGVAYTPGLTVPLSGAATASSTLAVTYTVVSGPATMDGTTLNVSGAGEVVIAASQAGDATWNPATDVNQTLSVSQAAQTITFDALAAKNYGDAAFTLSATGGGSGNPVTFSSSDPTIASCDGTNGATVTILKAGICVIYADQAGNSTYTAAAQVQQSLTINKGDQTLTLGQLPVGNQPLKDFTDPIQVTATSTSGLTVTIWLGSGSAATLNGSNQLENIGQTGTVVINLSQDGNDNYNAATGSYTFDVVKSNQSITFDALADKAVGDPDYNPGATASSALTVSYSSSNTSVASIVSGQIHLVGAGTTLITASQTGDATWNPALDEVQSLTVNAALTWTGALSTNWSTPGNWNNGIVPTATDNVIIPNLTNDPIVNEIAAAPAVCNNITIESGAVLTIAAGKALTVSGIITNNAGNTGLVVNSDASGTGSLINATVAVPATVKRYISGASTAWHLLSSPVAAQAISPAFTAEPSTSYDFFAWYEPTGEWVNFKNTSVAPTWNTANGTTNFTAGKGYLIEYLAPNPTKQFQGNLSAGAVSCELTKSGAGAYTSYNLAGNPYPSAIDWKAASGWNRDDLVVSGGGYVMSIWNDALSTGNYGVFNSAGLGGSGTNGATQYIPVSQGFMVEASVAGTLGMGDGVRVHNTQAWLKSNDAIANILRMKVSGNANTYSDEIMIEFGHPTADGGAEKMFSFYETAPSLYTVKPDGNYSIDFRGEAGAVTIPVSFNAGVDGSYTITASQLESFTSSSTIALEDIQAAKTQNLMQNPVYTFTAVKTDNAARFLLHFGGTFSLNDKEKETPVIIYGSGNSVYIVNKSGVALKGDVVIYNMIGQQVMKRPLGENSLTKIMLSGSTGYYLVKVITSENLYSGKVFINQK